MSFPRLILSGDQAKRAITAIAVSYDNDTSSTKPALLTRLKYDAKRQTRVANSSIGTAKRRQDLEYDSYRLAHTWIGYIDVLTESVAITGASPTIPDALTMNLIKSAVILNIPAHGVEHTIASFDTSELGPDKPSLGGIYTTAFDDAFDWVYNIKKNGPSDYENETTALWFIRDINIIDNHDNSSRVTFTFEFIEPWDSIVDVINGL